MTPNDVVRCSVCAAPGRRYINGRGCAEHTPARLLGRAEPPTPTCNKPLACYLPCCRGKVAPPSDVLRDELDERIEAWRQTARAEIMTLASLGTPFGPRELAALLPRQLAGAHARDWMLQLLDEGVSAGAITRVGDTEWKGARR